MTGNAWRCPVCGGLPWGIFACPERRSRRRLADRMTAAPTGPDPRTDAAVGR